MHETDLQVNNIAPYEIATMKKKINSFHYIQKTRNICDYNNSIPSCASIYLSPDFPGLV